MFASSKKDCLSNPPHLCSFNPFDPLFKLFSQARQKAEKSADFLITLVVYKKLAIPL